MPFDTQTRNRLARFVTDARVLITSEFAQQLQSIYGITVSGEITPLADLKHLDEEQRSLAELLRERLEYLKAPSADEKNLAGAAVDRLTREQAFTVLNRLAALRMTEKREFILESVGRGYQSKGFQVYSQVAGTGLGDTYHRYRRYLLCLFDELAVDVGSLFDRRSPTGLLFPRETALIALFQLINHPEIDALWADDETIGWIYQYYNDEAERKRMREESAAPRNSRELAVRNQFFTPRYVVEFLTDNTLARIWYEMTKGETFLKERCHYLVRRANEVFLGPGENIPNDSLANDLSPSEVLRQPAYVPHRQIKDPRELRLLDPACGSMHFGLYAFDVLEVIYEEAWDLSEQQTLILTAPLMPLRTTYPSREAFVRDIPKLIVENNIHGIDIDPRAVQIAGLSLWLRAQRTWHSQHVPLPERPRIDRSQIVCAEPMPGSAQLRHDFVETLRPRLLGQLVAEIFTKMQLAGEAGSLLKIEQEIAILVKEAKRQWQQAPRPEQDVLFDDLKPVQKEFRFDRAGVTDEQFWDTAEQRIYEALYGYAERFQSEYSHRMFADDTARGFAFVDLCRKKYDVVLMNPPFGDASLPSKPYLDDTYGDTRGDVYKAFVECFQDRILPSGFLGIISSRAGFFLGLSEDWRTRVILRLFRPVALADLGGGVLDAMVEVAAYVLRTLSTAEAKNLTVSLVPTLLNIDRDRKNRFSLAKWQVARGGLKRHQAITELLELAGEGFVDEVDGPYPRFVAREDRARSAPESTPVVFPHLICVRVIHESDKGQALLDALQGAKDNLIYWCNPSSFCAISGSPFAYWVGTDVLHLFDELPSFVANGNEAWMGLSSGYDFQWLRLRWEMPAQLQSRDPDGTLTGGGWVPLSKGGEYSPFYSDIHMLANWTSEGKLLSDWKLAELEMGRITSNNSQCWNKGKYFRPGATWSRRSQKGLSVRILPKGCIFGDKGPAALVQGDDETRIAAFVALFNSRIYRSLVSLQVAFGSYEVGVIQRTVIPNMDSASIVELARLATRAWKTKCSVKSSELTSFTTTLPALLLTKGDRLSERALSWAKLVEQANSELSEIQSKIDSLSLRLYGVSGSDVRTQDNTAPAPVSESTLNLEEEEEDAPGLSEAPGLAVWLIDYLVGCAFGRWDVRFATGENRLPELPDPFSALPLCAPGQLCGQRESPLTRNDVSQLESAGKWRYPLDVPWSGILVDDAGHPLDIGEGSRRVIDVIWGQDAEAIEQEACELLGISSLREYFRKPSGFFADHLRRYSKSRRQAPLYWPISTRSGNYTIWLHYMRLTAQTLHTCLADFIDPKLKSVSAEARILEQANGSQSRLGDLLDLEDELKELRGEIDQVIRLPYIPNLNDGVLITASPLWKLFRLPKWQKDLKACWEELEHGDYDWTHLANSIWPDRVKEKCKTDRSIAVAHSLEHLCAAVPPQPKAKERKRNRTSLIDESAI